MSDPTNVAGRRIIAFLIDAIVLIALFAGLFFLLAEHRTATGAVKLNVTIGDSRYGLGGGKASLFYLIEIGISFIYYVVIQGRTGATIGKALMGIRVQQEDGGFPPGMLRCLVRWFFLWLGGFTLYLVPLISMLVSKKHQRVGDMLVNTVVVKRAVVGQAIVAPVAQAVPQQQAPPPQPPA